MDSTAPQPTRKATPQYDGAAGIPFAMVMRYWWHIDPNRPGAVWQYYLATTAYNTAIACVLTLFFMMGNANAPLGNLFFETLVVSQCIGFCIHIGFDSFYTFTSDAWRAGLSVMARRAWHFAIPILGVYLGYTIAFALKGRNFFTLLMNYPRAGMLILMVGMLVSFIWFLVMDGQTRRLRAEAEEARAREAAVASQQQAKEAELRALQAQIEPHFLFNTLANVQALIDYEPTKARQMLESFIEYLRATLDASRRTQGTLGDEVAMLQRYLQLMQVRMGARLKAVWDIDPTLLSHPLAPLLLQPLVENAIKYGLEPQIQGGTVWVSASRHEGRVRIEVRDNGMGLNTQSASRKKTVEGGGTGLKNVTARLHSTFGEGATLTLANTPDGCSAIIEFDSLQDHSPIATL